MAQIHVCPEFLNLLCIAPVTASSKSASSKTTKGAWPPSSIETFLTVVALCCKRTFPTSVEPVNDIFLTKGFSVNSLPIALADPVIIFITPSGNPASFANAPSARAEYGVWLAGLITTVHPTARAGAHFLVIIVLGKFHGVIAPTTPTGCFITTILLSGIGSGIISP